MTHVLIVEPDRLLAARMAGVLDREQITLVATVAEAVEVIQAGGVHIGIGSTTFLRANDPLPVLQSVRWILLTPSADDEIAIHREWPQLDARFLYQDVDERYFELLPYRLRATTSQDRVMETIAARLPALVAYWDADERCLFANAAYADWVGIPIGQLIGMRLRDVLGSLYERNEPNIRAVLRGEPQRFERTRIGREGQPMQHVLATYGPDIRDGIVCGFVVTVVDIEEQVELRHALQEKERRWATLFDILPVGVTVVDAHGNILEQNHAISSILGLGEEALQQARLKARTYIDAGGLPLLSNQFPSTRALVERRVVGPVEIGIVREGQPIVWTLVTAAPFPDEDKVVVVTRDTTAEKKSAQLFKAIVDASPIPYGLNDEALNITYLNPAFTATFGYTREEIRNVADWWPLAYPDPDYRAQVQREWVRRLEQAKRDATTFEPMELTIRAKDGSQKIALVTAVTLVGTFAGEYLVVFLDLTDLRKAERLLEESRRLAGLGALAGGIAHDFNNLLTPILVHAEVALAEVPEESPVAASLLEIRAAANRATTLIRQILAVNRPEGESQTRVELIPMVNEVVHLLRASLPRSISVEMELDSDAPAVFANSTRIHRIISNLAMNARDAMANVGGVLTISVKRAEGDRVRIAVRDTGIGIPPEIKERVFEPYFTTKRSVGGTGLGLATVRSIVHALGGTISIDSELGKGTAVDVLLPAMPQARSKRDSASSPKVACAVTTSQMGLHILVVDDDAMVARAAARMITRLGHRTTIAESPKKALEVFRVDSSFDGVVTDYKMPEMTGLELAKSLYGIRRIPIWIATGYSDRLTEEALREAHVLCVLSKPFELSRIAATLADIAKKPD